MVKYLTIYELNNYLCNEYGVVRIRITQGINRHNPLMI